MSKLKTFLKSDWLSLVVIAVNFIFAFILYPSFPDKMPTHWNILGEIDGYMPKSTAAWLFPGIVAAMYITMTFFPFIDPKKANYAKFDRNYGKIKLLLVFVFSAINAVTYIASLNIAKVTNIPINMSFLMPIIIGIMFIILGNYLISVKQNWFLGIRTPWTIDNEEVWTKTHRLGGKLWVVSGIGSIIGAFISPIISFVLIIIASFVPVIYSYIFYRQQQKK